MHRIQNALALAVVAAATLGSCAVLRAGSYATEVFMREGDPALAQAALPTMMKASEALQLADPQNEGKALTTATLYVMYANAFLDGEAFILPDEEYERKRELSLRAKALYLRATALLVPAVERRYPGFFAVDFGDPGKAAPALAKFSKKDAGFLYWSAAAILSAFASDPMDFETAGLMAGALALFERALALDPDWNGGSLHELGITVYGSLPADLGGSKEKAKAEFDAAVAATGGASPGPYVSYASSVCVALGDAEGFESSLKKALSLEDRPGSALMDSLARRKARRLLADTALYF